MTKPEDADRTPVHAVVMRPGWLIAIAKAASSLRFTADNWEWMTDEAKRESNAIANTLTEIENAVHFGYARSEVKATEQGHVALELRELQQKSEERKTVAVCHRFLPTGDKDTVVRVVGESVTVAELNLWCDKVCAGDAVCMRFELVEQWQG